MNEWKKTDFRHESMHPIAWVEQNRSIEGAAVPNKLGLVDQCALQPIVRRGRWHGVAHPLKATAERGPEDRADQQKDHCTKQVGSKCPYFHNNLIAHN